MSLDVTLFRVDFDDEVLYSGNITNNLIDMAIVSELYHVLWRPETLSKSVTAKDLISPLRKGILELESNAEKYDKFNATNGWGKRKDLIRFCKEYLEACEIYPNARIWADS